MPKGSKHQVMDARNKMQNFLKNGLLPYISNDLNVHQIGRVIKYKRGDDRCDVQPLALQSDGDKRAALTDVIVPDSISMINDIVDFMKWADEFVDTYNGHTNPPAGGVSGTYHHFDKKKEAHGFKVGSVVWIEFADQETDNWTGKNNYKIDTKRMHSIQDAYIGGVIKP